MSKHTPGAWTTRGTGPNSARDLWSGDKNIGEFFISESVPLEEAIANARLGALAPELLEVLEEMTRRYEALEEYYAEATKTEYGSENGTIARAHKLIQKAKGQAE